MDLGVIQRYWHTIRHLRSEQIVGRLWFRLFPRRPDVAAAPMLRPPNGVWRAPALRMPSLVGATEFSFLGRCGRLDEVGWDGPARERLWRYNQHYFDDLNAEGSAARQSWHRALLLNWVESNPPATGTGWEPYPTSLRIVNWIKWAMAGNTLPEPCVHSLAIQARWLTKRLERHLLGNHLFANAKALLFAGHFFDGDEADQWRDTGLAILDHELPEQLLADGGNFELSTMYHALFLEDLLDLINVSCTWPGVVARSHVECWVAAVAKMLAWLRGMSHPDGEIALFNDAAFGIAPNPGELMDFAERLGLGGEARVTVFGGGIAIQHWRDSGYIRLEAPNAVAMLDVAKVGPDYLPGHAHADTLSFELSLYGQRVVVNGGTSRYGVGPERERERRTAAHSTVEVDGESSSEVWSGFRVARRAYPFDLLVERDDEMVEVACSHDGYRRLPGKPVHRRVWRFAPDTLDVSDSITGQYRTAVARYIFHPAIEIDALSNADWMLRLPSGQTVSLSVKAGNGSIEPANYAPRFGQVLRTRCLAVGLIGGGGQVSVRWG